VFATVESKHLKKAFEDIKPLLAGTENDRVLTFTALDNCINITASCGMVYQRRVPARCGDFFAVTVVYEDISALFEETGTCELELNKAYARLETASASVMLKASFTEKAMYEQPDNMEVHGLSGDFSEIMLRMSAVAVLEKVFMREAVYVFDGKCVTVKYPTVWVRSACECAPLIVSKSHADTIARLSPHKCLLSKDTVEFVKEPGFLVLPRTVPSGVEDFESLTLGMRRIAEVQKSNLAAKLKRIQTSLGKGILKVSVHKQGLILSMSKASISLVMAHGNTESAYVATIEVPIEYLSMCASLVQENSLALALEGGKFWIHGSNTDILMSV
jgi:hypothetical protein